MGATQSNPRPNPRCPSGEQLRIVAEALRILQQAGTEISRDALGNVIAIKVEGRSIGDEQMLQPAEVNSLRRLVLGGSGRRDRGPKALAKLPHLESLHLDFMELSAEAWQSLKGVSVTTYD